MTSAPEFEDDFTFETDVFAVVEIDGRQVAFMKDEIFALAREKIAQADRERAAAPKIDDDELPF